MKKDLRGESKVQYQIGDFSRISRLSIKTLRYYHECDLLHPTYIDNDTGYRYYNEVSLEKVNIINNLKELGFPLKEIKEILHNYNDDTELLESLMKKQEEIHNKIVGYQNMHKNLELLIRQTRQEEEVFMTSLNNEISEKVIENTLVASIRFKGRYQEIEYYLNKLYKYFGKHSIGSPFSLYYDYDFKEEDADIEACVPVKVPVDTEGIKSRIINGGKALTILHKGPYESIGSSYKTLIDHVNQHNMHPSLPTREVYLKGPGVIIPRNPNKFITEVQMYTR